MSTQRGSALKSRSKRDMEERLAFIRLYVKWLKENPDEVFSQQVKLVNSFLKAARDFPLTKEEYLRPKGELGK
ncbi:hypothetical protein CL1_0066 [Thermococcus cleftensis]|uniref:Uncharacterized protein n=1 Tax=Thermococcus cleftensis (strain DSM 27260 / KACC 17922 / CL1) TaxID=163003 RepID=I3ZRE7_THECF|nr:hypothetical protein [Thermococcus cleftensis]AFL94281.1 hypothetical protein CL1_0066 [Thermococcus cleftensis]